ncbi:MAG: F0F1 ATP synthase subunit A [Armatimonadetes bacterium]|nr:F0F1 ATP synthase subunit A [Armatimonadota bacterium]
MHVTPDEIVYWQSGPIVISATLVFTWAVMLLMVVGSWLITRRLTSDAQMSPGQNLLEIIVMGMQTQIREVSRQDPGRYLPFVGTLFLFILVCNVLGIIPGYIAPTGSLATTAALAICVAVAVPYHGIREQGLRGYLRQYLEPTVIMLPFNIFGELSRTLSLAVRLFGNVMSGGMIAGILLIIAPLFVPVLMQALGLLTGVVQAYIFAILAMVYIGSATQAHQHSREASDKGDG